MRLTSGTTQAGFEIQTDFNNPIRTMFTPSYANDGKHYYVIGYIPLYGITDSTKHPNYKKQYLYRVKSVGYDSNGGLNSEVTLIFDRINSVNNFQLQVKNFNHRQPINGKVFGLFINNVIYLYLYVDTLAYKVDTLAITNVIDGAIYEVDNITGLQLQSNNGTLSSSMATQYTTGNMTAGSNTLTVASVIDFVVGNGICVQGAGTNGATLTSTINAISGTNITLADNAVTSVTGQTVSHSTGIIFTPDPPNYISSQNVTSAGTIDLTQNYIWNLYGNGGTSLPITFSNYNYDSKVITLVIRSTNGTTPLTFSFASNVKLPSGFPTSATFSTAVACQFIWNSVLNVWQCVGSPVNVPTGL